MIYGTLPRASASSCPVSSDPEIWEEIHSEVEIRSESGRELNLLFETDAPKRNTRYGINLTKDDVIYLLESVAENMPGLTETFVKCLSRIIEKNVECVGRISKTLKSLEVYGPEKRAIEDLLSDVRPEQS